MHEGLAGAAYTGRALLPLLLAAVFAAHPGEPQAAIYRWVDAAGREYFTTDLNQVPPQHREAAEAAEKRSHSRINIVGGDASSSGEAASPAARRTEPTGRKLDRREPGGHAEAWWRAEHGRRLNDVARARKAVQEANDIHGYPQYYSGTTQRERARARNAAKRARSAAVERATEQLRTAEKQLADFLETARSAGVPPGWLR